MSNTETRPAVLDCEASHSHDPDHVQLIEPKGVRLGDGESLQVRRTLPSLRRSFVGAWCFVDHYGPEQGACMDVPPHPHTGLQTVSWLFDGEIEHRDSGGAYALVRPGELNLMTSGAGIAHSEVSTPKRDVLHGVQLWVVLPEASAEVVREFQHHVPELYELPGVRARVLVGSLADAASPVHTETPLLGAEVILAPGYEDGAVEVLALVGAYEAGAGFDRARRPAIAARWPT